MFKSFVLGILTLTRLSLAGAKAQLPTSTSTFTYPYVHGSLYSALSSSCTAALSTCWQTDTACASPLCRACTSLSISPSIEPCCAADDWAGTSSCFGSWLADQQMSSSSTALSLQTPIKTSGSIHVAVTSDLGSGAAACASVSSLVLSCQAQTPNFRDLDFSSMSSCICSTNGTNAPTVYDNFWSTCLAWVSTANSAEYSIVGQQHGTDIVRTPCQHFASQSSVFPTTSMLPKPSSTVPPPRLTSTSGVAGRRAKPKRYNIGMFASLIPMALLML